jgi:hypothetical protein
MNEENRPISISFILKDFDARPNKLDKLIRELNADYASGKLLISDEQWYHTIVLVGAVTKHNPELIDQQIAELESKETITGKLRELINLAIKFKNLILNKKQN